MIKLLDLLKEWSAQELINQLGGNKFIAMTGAKSFVNNRSGRSLTFRIPRAKNGYELNSYIN